MTPPPDLPTWTPDAGELADLELLLFGVLVEITLTGPAHQAGGEGRLILQDPEGVPLAVVTVAEDGRARLDFTLGAPEHGPFRRLVRSPAEVRADLPGGRIIGVTSRGTFPPIESDEQTTILLLPLLFGEAGPRAVRSALAAQRELPPGTQVVAVPLAPHSDKDRARARIAEAYGATEHIDVPDDLEPPKPPGERGLTVFFTGLSGSGKSTIARGLRDALLERGSRTVTLLDGDVVRRLLSAGLTFSRSDRNLNIRRIGYVAAEVTRHGGVAICAPIAPYTATRAEVRRMVTDVGDFVLVYVATPLEECERRDRKGLYAKARAGLIAEFTGISDPYEPPQDADLVLDTAQMSPAQAIDKVLALLTRGGWITNEDQR